MNNAKKKIFVGTGAAIGFVAIVAMMAQFMISNHLFGGSDASSEIFTRYVSKRLSTSDLDSIGRNSRFVLWDHSQKITKKCC